MEGNEKMEKEDGYSVNGVTEDSANLTPAKSETGEPQPTEGDGTTEKAEAPSDDGTTGKGGGESPKGEIVAVPYMNDGQSNVQMFFGSAFRGASDMDALSVAELYFFSKFASDDEPKWDGVLVCRYDFDNGSVMQDERNEFVTARDFKSKWMWKSAGATESVTFNVKCTMPRVWAAHFQSMLRKMEMYGRMQHSGQLAFNADGAGIFRPQFTFSSDHGQVDGHPPAKIASKAEELFSAV